MGDEALLRALEETIEGAAVRRPCWQGWGGVDTGLFLSMVPLCLRATWACSTSLGTPRGTAARKQTRNRKGGTRCGMPRDGILGLVTP